MWKSRISYGILILACLILMLVYSKPYLLYVAVLLLVLAACMIVLLRLDIGKLNVELKAGYWGQEGDTVHLKLKLNTEKHLLVTGGIYLRLAIINEMIGDTDYKSVFLPLAGREQEYDIPLILKCCGRIRSEEAHV